MSDGMIQKSWIRAKLPRRDILGRSKSLNWEVARGKCTTRQLAVDFRILPYTLSCLRNGGLGGF